MIPVLLAHALRVDSTCAHSGAVCIIDGVIEFDGLVAVGAWRYGLAVWPRPYAYPVPRCH